VGSTPVNGAIGIAQVNRSSACHAASMTAKE